jgi:hypothetical protein
MPLALAFNPIFIYTALAIGGVVVIARFMPGWATATDWKPGSGRSLTAAGGHSYPRQRQATEEGRSVPMTVSFAPFPGVA